jgi:amidase
MSATGKDATVSGSGFAHLEASVSGLQAEMSAGRLSARALTAAYIERIRSLDQLGPAISSVLELNPDALDIAEALDQERRASGPRGPLHGIPVLVKDNIATADRMETTAGSLVLVGVKVARDAHLVGRLRESGAVILGKTNLSEWANIRSSRSTSGWSARGGLTRNPYALDRNTSGSSSGSAAAITANLATVAVGTETDGSIVSPCSINGLVGLKPTVGLVSGDGIIPISHTQDTAGPMTRSVADAAALLGALVDPAPPDGPGAARPTDFTPFLDASGLAGARLGVVRTELAGCPGVKEVFDRALATLEAQGAILVDPVELKLADGLEEAELEVLLHELKAGLRAWFAQFAPEAPVATLRELIAWNEANRGAEMPWFGQEHFEEAESRGELNTQRYLDALATCGRLARDEGIDPALQGHDLDALVAPTSGPAWMTDLVNGDCHTTGFSTPAAVAGYPHLTVPSGSVHGLPVGLSFVGPAWSEPLLIRLGYSFEQAAQARRPPTFAPTLALEGPGR